MVIAKNKAFLRNFETCPYEDIYTTTTRQQPVRAGMETDCVKTLLVGAATCRPLSKIW
jgi:hypothetical protein